jgi:hypothetical protein
MLLRYLQQAGHIAPHNTGAGMVRSWPPLQRSYLLAVLRQQSFNQ